MWYLIHWWRQGGSVILLTDLLFYRMLCWTDYSLAEAKLHLKSQSFIHVIAYYVTSAHACTFYYSYSISWSAKLTLARSSLLWYQLLSYFLVVANLCRQPQVYSQVKYKLTYGKVVCRYCLLNDKISHFWCVCQENFLRPFWAPVQPSPPAGGARGDIMSYWVALLYWPKLLYVWSEGSGGVNTLSLGMCVGGCYDCCQMCAE